MLVYFIIVMGCLLDCLNKLGSCCTAETIEEIEKDIYKGVEIARSIEKIIEDTKSNNTNKKCI